MPVFLERFLLAVCAAAFFAVVFTNAMKFDTTQRVTAALALGFAAYFFAHTVYRHSQSSKSITPDPVTPVPTPNQVIERANSKPELSGRIEYSYFSSDYRTAARNTPASRKEVATLIFMAVRISNLGTPSIARDWRLTVEMPGSEPRTVAPSHFPGTMSFSREGANIIYNSKDAIYEKVGSTPITTGGEVAGLLAFEFLGLNKEELRERRGVLKLTFADVTGREYEATQVIKGKDDEGMVHIPGVEARTVPASKTKKAPRKGRK